MQIIFLLLFSSVFINNAFGFESEIKEVNQDFLDIRVNHIINKIDGVQKDCKEKNGCKIKGLLMFPFDSDFIFEETETKEELNEKLII
jgi:hypothetical protein